MATDSRAPGSGPLLLAVIVIVAVAIAFGTASPTPPPLSGRNADATIEAAALAAESTDSTPAPEPVVRREAPSPRTAAPARSDANRASLRGRVVDPDGRPVAGVTAEVRRWIASTPPRETAWIDPRRVVTGSDGRFEIALGLPRPHPFALDLRTPGRVAAHSRWLQIAPGTVEDLGDVTMREGARVTGRFVDPHGIGVPLPTTVAVQLSLCRLDGREPPGRDLATPDVMPAMLAPDGTFSLEAPIDPGTWRAKLSGLMPEQPDPQVEVVEPATRIEIVVLREQTLLRIGGIVVDEAGQPIHDAKIWVSGTAPASGWTPGTDRDGTFEVVQRPSAVDPAARFTLHAAKTGYRSAALADACWGRLDLRIVLAEIPAMQVLVVRADDGTPVEEYGLRVLSADGAGSLRERSVIDGWAHARGSTRVAALERSGQKLIVVEPRADSGLAPSVRTVDVDAKSPPRLTIELPTSVRQPIRLLHADGRPAWGSWIELIHDHGEPLAASAEPLVLGAGSASASGVKGSARRGAAPASVLPPAVPNFFADSGSPITDLAGIQIDRAEAGPDGRCTVIGPPDVPLTIRCLGDHPAMIEHGLHLVAEERVLRLPAGATAVIRVAPPDVLPRRPRGDLPTDVRAARGAPSVKLRRESSSLPPPGEFFPQGDTAAGVAFDEAGTAVLRNVPAGVWRVQCEWPIGDQRRQIIAAEPLELTAGGVHEYVLDMSAYRIGSVTGRLLVNGRPRSSIRLTLRRTLAHVLPDGSPATEAIDIVTGEGGSFRCELPVGAWSASARLGWPSRPGRAAEAWVRAVPDIAIAAGTTQVAEVRAEITGTELRVRDHRGQPVPGLRLWPRDAGPLDSAAITPTDADGRATMFGSPRAWHLSCLIRSFTQDATYDIALRAALQAHDDDARAARAALDAVVELPDPIALPTQGVVEIRLPESWDR